MGQVNATIAGRQYRLACEDGQEDHLLALAKDIDTRIIDLRRKFGEIGDTRLTVMAGLMLAEPGADPTTLRKAVTSPNGTTERAIATFNDRGMPAIIADGARAAAARAAEITSQLA